MAKKKINTKEHNNFVKQIRIELKEGYPDIAVMDGYDDCIIGVCTRFGQEPIVAYDRRAILERHMRDGMSYEEAIEFFDFNQIGAWVGERTPCFIDRLPSE